MIETRLEHDSMGELEVPASALYGASTQRAVENFPISGEVVAPALIHAYGLIKEAAALANAELKMLPAELAEGIAAAAREVAEGKHDLHFPVDVFQTGSGTSTNMNVNEVIANLCSRSAGESLASRKPAHPNDHINLGQSSNDTFPTAIHLATCLELRDTLIPALECLQNELSAKAEAFHPVLKIGRTHLMDATPMRLGQEFSGYAKQVERGIDRAHKAIRALLEVPLGGTAIGTGLNRHPDFPDTAIHFLREKTGLELHRAENPFEAQAARDALVEAHGQLNTIATSLFKIANDIRLLGSGPRCSLGEIKLPALQPGSSIMPGKVNPVLCEAVTMVAARVFGNQASVTFCGANGQFELNTFMPLLGQCMLESIKLLAGASTAFAEKCVAGIVADRERCEELIELSLSMVTSLVPLIGYDKAAAIAKASVQTGKTVRQLCREQLDELAISNEQLEAALAPATMADPPETGSQ
ncbi:class II fumarate hydratase [Luteolibacter algae]|uniref:Fumarate hydratase class II n=1 Tax=Luteolibacter algae TaxID=454151 RepID=A0ABW5D6Q3_9BACT